MKPISILVMLLLASICNADDTRTAKLAQHFRLQAEKGEPMEHPWLTLGNGAKVGDFGLLLSNALVLDFGRTGYRFKLLQKLSDAEALIIVKSDSIGVDTVSNTGNGLAYGRTSGRQNQLGPFVLKGVDVSKLADDSEIELDGAFEISGTHKYSNVVGSTTSAFVIEPVELMPVPDYPEQLDVGVRTWKDKTGRFSRDGTFVDYSKGKVTIRLEDGKSFEVSLSLLDGDSGSYIRDHIRYRNAWEKRLKEAQSAKDGRPRR